MNVYRLKLHRCYIQGVKIIIWRGRIIAGGYNNYTGHERKEREWLPLDKRHLAGAIIVAKEKKNFCKLSRFSSFVSRKYLNNNLQLFILQFYEILSSKLFFFSSLFFYIPFGKDVIFEGEHKYLYNKAIYRSWLRPPPIIGTCSR